MSTVVEPSEERAERRGNVGDSLASAVTLLIVFTILQRGTGFLRNIWICKILEPEDLGFWNMAKSFLVLAAPLIVLGLPGTFKRYLSHYREQGRLHQFLRRTTAVTAALTLVGCGLTVGLRHQVAWATFGDPGETALVMYLALTLLFVVLFNFGIELLTALRKVKAVSVLQLANSVLFALVTVPLIVVGGMRAEGVVAGFALANLVTAAAAFVMIYRSLDEEPQDQSNESVPTHPSVWRKVAPFAAWFWLGDLLANLFTNVDRIMIVHLADNYGFDAMAMIGQYHSSQIIGVLLIGLTSMIGGVLLSYLSHDWETGRRDAAESMLDFALKIVALTLTLAAAGTLLFAPAIFNFVLDNKFAAGFRVLPLTMTYCIWFGLLVVAHNFLWCRERASLVSMSLVAGLLLNVVLNYLWLPRWGLDGAVLATAVANLLTLAFVCWLSHFLGMRYSVGTFVTMAVPATLHFGGGYAILAVVLVLVFGWQGRWLFTEAQRQQLIDWFAPALHFLGRPPHNSVEGPA